MIELEREVVKQDGLQRMLDFLALLTAKGIEFRIEQQAPDELMVAFAIVGVRVEVVFSVDRMQFSYFKGNEDVLFDEKVLLELIKENWDECGAFPPAAEGVTSMSEQERALKKKIRRLVQGLMTQSDRIVLLAHKQLYEAGSLAIPLLQRELDRADLSKTMRREAMSAVVGLTALLHNIDESASNVFIEKALRFKQNPALTSALRAVQRYSNSKFRASNFNGVPILEEATLDANYKATAHVTGWLRRVPTRDLKGISRIYIVQTKPSFDSSEPICRR